MTNSDIADLLKRFADLSELHGGNPFKIRSYAAASFRIDKLTEPLSEKSLAELEKTEGIGKSLATRIVEINEKGTFDELEDLLQLTPPGVLDLFKVKGIGPKKIAFIWNDLGIESIGELLYACKENRLAQAKGFGQKTQLSIIQHIEFMMASAHRFHYSNIERTAMQLQEFIGKIPTVKACSFTGALRRKCEIIDVLELIVATDQVEPLIEQIQTFPFLPESAVKGNTVEGKINGSIPLSIQVWKPTEYALQLFVSTGNEAHVASFTFNQTDFENEPAIYASFGMPFIEPELREGRNEIALAKNNQLPLLIETKDLKGILHNHTDWSDGANTLEEMATYCRDLGYQYLGICDHSKSAFYAKGLNEERVVAQHIAIDALNQKLYPFKLFKGIESDILNDGQLDYSNDILKTFDFIVASVHSNLKMTEEKAMSRIIKAIENPFTTILGHPTGRLLLMREGYPLDHKKMIDACAANQVIIELNANPYRLDLDWRWIDYALNKNVMISINPDAHEKEGYQDMYYGVCVARKGGLTADKCFNALELNAVQKAFELKRTAAI